MTNKELVKRVETIFNTFDSERIIETIGDLRLENDTTQEQDEYLEHIKRLADLLHSIEQVRP